MKSRAIAQRAYRELVQNSPQKSSDSRQKEQSSSIELPKKIHNFQPKYGVLQKRNIENIQKELTFGDDTL